MQELEKILEEIEAEHPYKIPGDCGSYSQYNEAWHDAIDRVRGRLEIFFKERTNDGWIPVEKELPEDDMPTPKLVTALVPDRKAGWDTSETFSVVVDTDVYDPGYTGKWECYKKNVIAWRPLPEPYARKGAMENEQSYR